MKILFGPAKSQTLDHPYLIELYRYWDSKRGERRYPSRGMIDPCEIKPFCLPHVLLIDVFHEPLRFRYRLVGTGVTALAGKSDLTGKWVDEETFGDFAKSVQSLYLSVVETRKPIRAHGMAREFRGSEWITLENIFLPLGETDDRVTMVLAGAVNLRCRPPSGEDTGRGALHVAADPAIADGMNI